MFQTKTVPVEGQPERLADERQHQHIQEYRESVTLKTAAVGKIAKPARPSRRKQCNKHGQSKREFAYTEPAADAVVFARLWRIGRPDGRGACHRLDYGTAAALARDSCSIKARGSMTGVIRLRGMNEILSSAQNVFNQFRRSCFCVDTQQRLGS